MRLTCPSCGAIYVVQDDAVPSGGSHVQCSACHTRWFARPAPAPERLSEEQIIARLETRWSQSVSGDEEPARSGGAQAEAPANRREPPPPPIAFPTSRRKEPRAEAKAPETERSDDAQPHVPAAAAASAPPVTPERAGASTAPSAPRPAASQQADAPDTGSSSATPLRPRAAGPRKPPASTTPARRGSGGAVAGFLLPLALAAAGLGVYLRADDLRAAVPAAAPALGAYVARVDAGRDWVEARIAPLRARVGGSGD